MSDPLLHDIPPLWVQVDPSAASGTQSAMRFDFLAKRITLEILHPLVLGFPRPGDSRSVSGPGGHHGCTVGIVG